MGNRLKSLSKSILKATKDHIKTKADQVAVDDGCYFDPDKAKHVIEFLRRFVRVQINNSFVPFELLEWQKEITDNLFGWRRKDGKRRFTQAYISVAKKNGKTQLLSALTLYMLCCEVGIGQECYSLATEREQAAQVFRECAKLINASPELQKILTISTCTKTINFEGNNSFYRAWSADNSSKEGFNVSFLVYDELHAALNRELFDAVRYAGSAIEFRTGQAPLMVNITTAGYNRESICYEQYTIAKNILNGINTDITFYPFVAELSVGEDWTKEENWYKANPGLGIIIPLTEFRRDYEEARTNPAKENSFRRYKLNQWTEQASRWIPLEIWDKNGGTIDYLELQGRECYGGLDLASKQDTSAFQLVFINSNGGYDIITKIFIPEDNIKERELRHGVPYSSWVKEGLIIATPGNTIDYKAIKTHILELAEIYHIKEIAYDPYDATMLVQELQMAGMICVPVAQGVRNISAPAKEFERLLLSGKLNHGNHPVLRWQASNVEVKQDENGNIKPVKPVGKNQSGPCKIDAIIATLLGLDRAMRNVNSDSTTSGIQISFM